MHHRLLRASLALLLGLGFVACGGSAASQDTAVLAGGATEAPPIEAGSAGGGSADACALLTADEVTAATGQPGIEAQPIADAETDALSGCGFVSNGLLPVVIISILDPATTNSDASSYLALPGSVEVPVSGARAIFMVAAGYVMAVVKGDSVVTYQVAMPAEGEDFQMAATKLVQKIADRMP